ncbi:MAG: TonB-dependent receptor domain-containing protein [Flavobacteriales bacterium]
MKTNFFRMLVVAVFSIMSGALFAQGSLVGNVQTGSNEPLSFAVIRIENSSFGCIADESGNYRLAELPAGAHKVIVSYVGYEDATRDVTITNGQETKADFVLKVSSSLNEVVVTGLINPKSALESSISISTISARQAEEAAPRSTAEILRSIPGIRSEASAGDGNTNITVRGVPIATGGSKFLQLHEDGLPVLQFGDIAFATADMFTRMDYNVDRVEALRGGSASTLASNSPAGVVNFISKTGSKQGGSLGNSFGLDYKSFRTDFEYGAPIANNWTFHMGGFFRQGDGPRDTHMTSNYGGQFKANATRYFDKGYGRVYFKYLNDRTPAYMPMPMTVSGTNADPTWGSVAGYDAVHGALQSPYLMNLIGTGPDGQLRRSSVADGINTMSSAIGSEFAFDLGQGWNVINRSRMAWNKGSFTAPFPAEVGNQDALATAIAGAGYVATYAASGDTLPTNANGNGLLMRMHMFDTQLNNFNNFTNDFNVSKTIGKAKINVGMYKAFQNISMSWVWNSYLVDVNDQGSQLVNLTNADTSYTDNGVLAYGVPAWGNCCHRNYDTRYDITAPYAGVEVELTDALTVDGSVRFDMGDVNGSYAGGNGQTKPMDVDGDGEISLVEENVATINNNDFKPVSYDYNYTSYSLGVNYRLNENMAVFARHSTGGRANADRLLFTPYIQADGSAASGLSADMVTQSELGYKLRNNKYALNATAFMSNVEEQNYEATTQNSVNRVYQAIGLELDGQVMLENFVFRGGLTYTQAEIKEDVLSPTLVGNTPRRQSPVIYQFMPSYKMGRHSIGVSLIGTGKSYAQDNNELVMPGYAYLNAFVSFGITEKMYLNINGNNLMNTIGVTESEEGSILDNAATATVVRARSIAGRSISATLRFDF